MRPLSVVLLGVCLALPGAAIRLHAQEPARSDGWVVIPVADYRALRAKAYPDDPVPAPPPVDAALTRLAYRPDARRRLDHRHGDGRHRRPQGRLGRGADPRGPPRARREARRPARLADRSALSARPAVETRALAAHAPDRAARDARRRRRVGRRPAGARRAGGGVTADPAGRRGDDGGQRVHVRPEPERRNVALDGIRSRERAAHVPVAPSCGRSAGRPAAAPAWQRRVARRPRRRLDAADRHRADRGPAGPGAIDHPRRPAGRRDQPGLGTAGRRLGCGERRRPARHVPRTGRRGHELHRERRRSRTARRGRSRFRSCAFRRPIARQAAWRWKCWAPAKSWSVSRSPSSRRTHRTWAASCVATSHRRSSRFATRLSPGMIRDRLRCASRATPRRPCRWPTWTKRATRC